MTSVTHVDFRMSFFFDATATTEIYTLSLHDALPICALGGVPAALGGRKFRSQVGRPPRDRKSTRLNSSHSQISYAVFCLKKKKVECMGKRIQKEWHAGAEFYLPDEHIQSVDACDESR